LDIWSLQVAVQAAADMVVVVVQVAYYKEPHRL